MKPSKQSIVVFLALLFALSLLVRIPGLLESLWYDEACRTQLMLNAKNIWRLLFHDVHNFLYNGLMYVWINVFGDSEVSIRVPSLLLGYSAAIIFCLWASRRFSSKIGWGVLVWILFSPFHIWYSTEAKNNAMVIFFTVLIFVGYANLLENGTWKWVTVATVAGVFGIFTDFLLMLPLSSVLVMAIVDLMRRFSPDRLKRFLVAFVLTALLVSPLVIFKLSFTDEMFRDYMKPLNLEELYLLLFNFLSNGNTILAIPCYRGLSGLHGLWPWLFLVLSSLILLIVFCKSLCSLMKSRAGTFVNIAFLVPILVIFIMTWYMSARYGGKHFVYLERSLGSVILFLYTMILIHGAFTIGNLKFRYGILAIVFALNLIGTGLMLTVNKDQWTVYKPNPDWRALANDIKKDMTGSVVLTSCWPLAMQYYMKESAYLVTPMRVRVDDNPQEIRAYIRREFQKRNVPGPRFFYIVINRYWDPFGLQYVNDGIIQRIYPEIERKHYLGLEVYKYGMPN